MPTKETQAECPICGHMAVVVVDEDGKTIYCPDKYCPNHQPHDLAA